jgi:hypothetical protein
MAETERIPPEILRKVRAIELSTRHLVDDFFGGEYHSVFKGTGMEFDEVREYAPGDEVRSIDWNVTARMGRPFIKRYREERELTVLLMVDASASGLFGSRTRLKSEVIAEVASVLAFSAIRNQDKVGCLIFTDRVEMYIPPEKGHRHVLRIIRELLYFKPVGSGTDLATALETAGRLLKRRAVVFLVSDFLAEDFETALRLTARRHDLVALNIRDPLEADLPDVGLLQVADAETGERVWIDTGDRWVRRHFSEEAAKASTRLSQLCARHGVDEIRLDASEDYAGPLVQFFRRRAKRLAKGFGRAGRAGARAWLPPLLAAAALALGSAGAFAQRPTVPQAPPGRPVPPPGAAPGRMAPGQMAPGPGQPGPQGPAFQVLPRAALEDLDLPALADLTGSARPRLDTVRAAGIAVETRLARDLQAVGQPNELRWRVLLAPGARLDSLVLDFGRARAILPLPPQLGNAALAEELASRQAAGAAIGLADFLAADTLRGAGADTLEYRLAFTCAVPDTFLIPAQMLRYRLGGDTAPRSLSTAPLALACLSTLASGPDSSALRDWKAPGELRGDWLGLAARWGLPIALLLALLLWLLLWYRRRRARRLAPEAPPVPADEEALAALEALALADLPARGAFADYYFELSRILRHYLARRFSLPFRDWTTEEIESALAGGPAGPRRLYLDADLTQPLLTDLARGDLVKFARRQPSRAECLDSMAAARRLIKATRPLAEAPAPAAPAETPGEVAA